MIHSTKKVIFIIGPTAIGKTELSIKLAKKLNTEIISCDSRQFYKELNIGAAPPSTKERSIVKHHFIQNLSITENYNAGKFEIDAIRLIKELHQIKETVIVVGGSGLYIDAICKGFDSLPEISDSTRQTIKKEYNTKGISWLQKEVKNSDPEFYNSCDPKNPQRLSRALEVFRETGKRFSQLKLRKIKNRPFKIIKIGLNIEREELYKRINKRVDIMMQNGLLREARSLSEFQNKNALKTVGYQEIFQFLNNQYSLEESVKKIKQNTRRFAKRQLTWFRKDKEIKWFKPNQLIEINKFISKL